MLPLGARRYVKVLGWYITFAGVDDGVPVQATQEIICALCTMENCFGHVLALIYLLLVVFAAPMSAQLYFLSQFSQLMSIRMHRLHVSA
jgi:hypothetical protein